MFAICHFPMVFGRLPKTMENPVVQVKRLRTHPGVIFQLEWRACGKSKCRCMRDGELHGPYWFAYRWSKRHRRQVSAYIGRVFKPYEPRTRSGGGRGKAGFA